MTQSESPLERAQPTAERPASWQAIADEPEATALAGAIILDEASPRPAPANWRGCGFRRRWRFAEAAAAG